MTILLLHHRDARQAAIREALENCGRAYIEAADPEEALELLDKESAVIHSIIADFDQVREARYFLTALSRHAALKDIPLILSLAGNDPELMQPFTHSSSHLWLAHPFTEKNLYWKILSAENELSQRRALRREIQSRESVIGAITRGTFHIQTLEQAEALTTMLSLASPEPDRIAFGLFELLANGIEHGNLGLAYAEKQTLIAENRYREEIKRRLELPENKQKYVEIIFERESNLACFKITDQGQGFDFAAHLESDLANNHSYHGRGIALARATSFDYLEYLGKGNKVFAITRFAAQ